MGTDDIFKKRRKSEKKRKIEIKRPKANSYLIVTEGERTEPLYFCGLKQLIEERIGGTIDVTKADNPSIEICGQGTSTTRLIEIAEKLVKDSKVIYQNVWVVFDKDDFEDFDVAIKEGTDKGFKVAWSNQSFEYWLYLHFNYCDSALHRDDWCNKLDEIFKTYGIKNGKYEKNYTDIYTICNSNGSVSAAIKHAKRRMADFRSSKDTPSSYDPGTTVHILVSELIQYLEE